MLDFATAWATYRRYERFLPAVPATRQPARPVASLAALLDGPLAGRIDALLFDAYGVLNRGEQPIDGAGAAFAAAQRRGLPLVIVTNDASGDREAIAAKHRRRGFAVDAGQLVAGIDLLDEALHGVPGAARFGYLGPARRPCPAVTADLLDIAGDGIDLDALEGFVLLESPGWDARLQSALGATLSRRPRPIVVGNPDVTAPDGARLSVEPGYHVVALAERTGIVPQLLGKPGQAVYARALRQLGSPAPERVLAIGDTLHTDILGARCAGLRSLLVTSGLLRDADAAACIAACGITPDFIAARI